ncbi:MAG: hypothetical protein R3C12_21060 [Planctomycetaceae bacterium]
MDNVASHQVAPGIRRSVFVAEVDGLKIVRTQAKDILACDRPPGNDTSLMLEFTEIDLSNLKF